MSRDTGTQPQAAATRSIARVAVVGAGPLGCASAAHLIRRGHDVALWSPRTSRLAIQDGVARLTCAGALEGEIALRVLAEPDALADADIVFLCLPGDAYGDVLQRLMPVWRDGQTLVVSGSLSLSPLWLAETLRASGRRVQVAGWGTTLTTAHFLTSGVLHANPLRHRIDMATLAVDGIAPAESLCEALLGERFVAADSLLAPTLANINPIAHAAEVIPNLTRMDRGESWSLFQCFTPVVARMADRLDAERLAVATAFGLVLPSLSEHYARSYHVEHGPLESMAAQIHAQGMSPLGPATLQHRYVLEDAPFGLAFLEQLGRTAGVPTPFLSNCIDLLETVYGQRFRGANFLIDALGLAQSDVATLRKRCAAARSR